MTMANNKKTYENVYYPVPRNFSLENPEKPPMKQAVIKRLIQKLGQNGLFPEAGKALGFQGKMGVERRATKEQMETVIHLIESLQPTDAIEVALASQFAITYIRAMESSSDYGTDPIHLGLFRIWP